MAVTIPKFQTKDYPDFTPYNFSQMEEGAVNVDRDAYQLSDADFAARHPRLRRAEGLFEGSVLRDQTEDPLSPALQNEFMRSGLGATFGSFGDASTAMGTAGGGTLAPDSGGTDALGRALGNSIEGYQQQQRQNREQSLSLAENLFPRRKIGMSGQDYTLTSMLNTQGFNNWNQSRWANQANIDQLNWRANIDNLNAQQQQANANAAGSAQQSSSGIQAGASIAGALVMALAMSCWVARAAYGADALEWRIFRRWLLADAPGWLRRTYLRHGPRIASVVAASRALRALTRALMGLVVNPTLARWSHV